MTAFTNTLGAIVLLTTTAFIVATAIMVAGGLSKYRTVTVRVTAGALALAICGFVLAIAWNLTEKPPVQKRPAAPVTRVVSA